MMLAQLAGLSVVQLAIAAVIVAAIIGIVFIAMRQFGVSPPAWAIQMFWICVCACGAILAIRFVAGL